MKRSNNNKSPARPNVSKRGSVDKKPPKNHVIKEKVDDIVEEVAPELSRSNEHIVEMHSNQKEESIVDKEMEMDYEDDFEVSIT